MIEEIRERKGNLVGDSGGHPSPPAPPPPPPPPPPVIVDVRTLPGGDSGSVIAAPVRSPHRRGNPDAVPEGQPPDGTVIGRCDHCGHTGAELVAWRVELGTPPDMILRGICASCAVAEEPTG